MKNSIVGNMLAILAKYASQPESQLSASSLKTELAQARTLEEIQEILVSHLLKAEQVSGKSTTKHAFLSGLFKAPPSVSDSEKTSLISELTTWLTNLAKRKSSLLAAQQALSELKTEGQASLVAAFLQKLLQQPNILLHCDAQSLIDTISSQTKPGLREIFDYLAQLKELPIPPPPPLSPNTIRRKTFQDIIPINDGDGGKKHETCIRLLYSCLNNYKETDSCQHLANKLLQKALLIQEDLRDEPEQPVPDNSNGCRIL